MIWIDRTIPPNHRRPILIWVVDLNNTGGCYVGYYDHDYEEYFICSDGVDHAYDYFVSYWMELPGAPPLIDN